MLEIMAEIEKLKRQVEQLSVWESGNIQFLNQVARVLADTTPRATGYNTNIQVTGVGGLPSNIRGIFFNLYLQPTTAVRTSFVIENPSYPFGAFTYQCQAAGLPGTNAGFVSLNNAGQLRINIAAGDATGIYIDVWAYVAGKTP